MRKFIYPTVLSCCLSFLYSCSGDAPRSQEDSVTKRDVTKDSMQVDTHKNASRLNGQRPVGDTLHKKKHSAKTLLAVSL